MCHSYGLLCHLIIVITCENLQRRKVTDSPMCLSRYMHVACVLAVESLTRTCDSASILEPVTAASKNQRHVLCWAPLASCDGSHLIPTPATSSLPPQGFPADTKMQDATELSQHPYIWNPKMRERMPQGVKFDQCKTATSR